MKPPFLRTEYNYDMLQASTDSGLSCKGDPSKAQQHFKDECDINTIVERFGLTGEMPQVLHLPQYQDFNGIFDFQSAMNAVRSAQESFDSLPAKLRTRFDNQPQKLLEFLSNQENKDEAIKLGLVNKPAPAIVEPPAGNPEGAKVVPTPPQPPKQ